MDCPPKKRKLNLSSSSEKPPFHPVLPEELMEDTPLAEVYIDTISDPKNISKVVVQLNSLFPLADFTHLKRVKGKDVILFPRSRHATTSAVSAALTESSFDESLLKNEIRAVSVAKFPPRTKKQHENVHKLWPCNFHSNKYTEKLCTNTLFNQKEIDDHVQYMQVAIDLARKSGKAEGVIVVDPIINSIVAVGFDETEENPCQHAVMVAIDNVALTQNGGAWQASANLKSNGDLDIRGIPESVLSYLVENHKNLRLGANKYKGKSEIESPSDGPYLCTGYYLYVTHEPCIMCAMALIHSRIKRVFYGCRKNKGALGSLCKIHTVKDLNHHYEVFAGLLENECKAL